MTPVLENPVQGTFTPESGENFAPALQLLTSACWLSLKEAGLVVGVLARHIPLLGRVLC